MTANRPAPGPDGPRRGYTLVEVAMAVLVVMVAMNLVVSILGRIGIERRGADRQLLAMQEVANALERLSAEPFDRINTDRVRAVAAEWPAARFLPEAEWDTVVVDETEPIPARRVTLGLRWADRSGGRTAPVRLTAWFYRRGDRR